MSAWMSPIATMREEAGSCAARRSHASSSPRRRTNERRWCVFRTARSRFRVVSHSSREPSLIGAAQEDHHVGSQKDYDSLVVAYPSRFVHIATALAAGVLLTEAAVTAQFSGGGGAGQERAVVAAFDTDKNGRLDTVERQAARRVLEASQGGFGGRGRGGGRGGGNRPPASPGVKLTSADVTQYADAPLYDPATLRTFFLEFEDAGW